MGSTILGKRIIVNNIEGCQRLIPEPSRTCGILILALYGNRIGYYFIYSRVFRYYKNVVMYITLKKVASYITHSVANSYAVETKIQATLKIEQNISSQKFHISINPQNRNYK